jgi:sulfotransferase
MIKKIFYNSSLPRSGSTLLQNVLMQNPEIYSTPTSGVIDLLLTSRSIYSTNDAFRAQDPDEVKRGFINFCKEGLYGYYKEITDRPYVMEKSRGWAGNYNFLTLFDENPKILVMVRDLRAVFASMEKNFRKNPDKDPQIVNVAELKNMTTDSRLQYFSSTPPVGPSLEWLYDVFLQKYSDKIHFIKFEDFCQNTDVEMRKIYNYLELPYFRHDFNNVQQLTYENDVIHGIFGDHRINPQIRYQIPDYLDVLGEKNCQIIKENYKWFFEIFGYN